MPTATPSLPPLSPRLAPPAVPAMDDVKLQFATEEVRKRFSSIAMSEMLQVLSLLLTDRRLPACESGGGTAWADGKTPKEVQLEQGGLTESRRRNSSSVQQQLPSGNSSATASDLSPGDWGSMVLESSDGALHGGAGGTARLNREWRNAVTLILDNARHRRQSDSEHGSIRQVVQESIGEWCSCTGAAEAQSPSELPAVSCDPEQAVWLSVLAKVCRLSEEACSRKYEAQYHQLRDEADNENDEGAAAGVGHDDDSAVSRPSVIARRSAHRSTASAATGSVGIPPFSLVIQCAGPADRVPATATPHDAEAEDANTTCLVVGCEWFEWVFLVQCPVACASEPYPVMVGGATEAEAAAVREARRRWRQRHCFVQLLYPSEAGFSASPDSGSDLRSADAEYELSEPQVVLTSLLGVAMRVWCQSHPHLVAEVFQLEEDTYPQHLYDGATFWSVWPNRDPSAWQRCENAGASDSMPIPLLPGECFAHDSDLEETEEEESENADE